ncbi:ferritin-like domain-containing protein [Kineococcus sp. GCM10028916]|uniref:ferritin-like domain-containing protein n=1 Tax=Kineococcus sp. GCM10028916 TaxID=3273394 RepID=UPI00363626F5
MLVPPRHPVQPLTRRTALRGAVSGLGAGLAVLGLGGCDVRWVSGAETTPTAQRGPDDDARDAAVADTRDLLGLLLPTARAAEPLGSVATLAVQACEAHLRALGEEQFGVTSSGGTAAVDAAAVLDRLAVTTASALTAASRTDRAPSAGMARLLAAVGASRAVLLDDVSAATGVAAPAVALPAAAPAPATPTPTPSEPEDRAGTAALQAALAGEHAAVFGFALVEGRLPDPRRAEAAADLAAHRVARDDLVDVLVSRGGDPAQAAVGYDAAVPTAEAATALAATMTERLTGAYADVVATSAPDRPLAVSALVRNARAARRWGSTVTSFPGMAELAEDGTSVPRATSSATATATSTP